jgi:DNA polymerase V
VNDSRGGKRSGAGRPKGTGKYGEKTIPIRVPESLVLEVLDYVESKGFALPFYSCAVSAGLPTSADDHTEGSLDLNQHLIKHPASTFFVRVSGDSMILAGIHEGDILVVDRSLEPRHGKVVIAAIDGHLTVKRLCKIQDRILLMPENENYQPIELQEGNDMVIWGVVTNVVHGV